MADLNGITNASRSVFPAPQLAKPNTARVYESGGAPPETSPQTQQTDPNREAIQAHQEKMARVSEQMDAQSTPDGRSQPGSQEVGSIIDFFA